MTQIHESRGQVNEGPSVVTFLKEKAGGGGGKPQKEESDLAEGTKAAVRHETRAQAFLAARPALLSLKPASLP